MNQASHLRHGLGYIKAVSGGVHIQSMELFRKLFAIAHFLPLDIFGLYQIRTPIVVINMVDEDISIGAIGLEALASTDPMPPPLDRQQLYEFFKVSEADNSIRVLDIDALPRPSTGDIELSARLRVVSLDSNPQFAALSYVWGDYSAPVKDILTIHLDDGRSAQVQITANCKDAIQAIGNKFGPLTIWIDAICINQEDEDEKASQILHLEDIYTWAEMVYVWLGPDTKASRKLFRWLSFASAYLHFTDVVALGKASTPTERLSQRRKLLLNIVVNFFRRLWTRQLASIDFWLTILTFWRGDFFKGTLYQLASLRSY